MMMKWKAKIRNNSNSHTRHCSLSNTFGVCPIEKQMHWIQCKAKHNNITGWDRKNNNFNDISIIHLVFFVESKAVNAVY